MQKTLLIDAVQHLETLAREERAAIAAQEDAVRQFNALLSKAKESFGSERVDIQVLMPLNEEKIVMSSAFISAIARLKTAILLRPPGTPADVLRQIHLPPDAPNDLGNDLAELGVALELGLAKTALLLAGYIAESLLIARHPDKSDRGPGLGQLIEEARKKRLFAKDTLRHLENLQDYRDLIHPRAEKRNKTVPSQARVEGAVISLKLLCSELAEETTLRF